MGMEIDSLEVAIRAQAQDASKQIDTLYGKLGSLSKALNGTAGSYRKTATEIGRVTAAIRGLAATKIPNLDGLIRQLDFLSKLDLSNVSNKKINIDIGINAPQTESQIQWAIDKARSAANANSDKIAESLIQEYAIVGKAKGAMRAAVSAMMQELTAGFDGNGFTNALDIVDHHLESIVQLIRDKGNVAAASIGDIDRIMEATAGKTDFVVGKMFENDIMTPISDIGTRITNPEIVSSIEQGLYTSVQKAMDSSMSKIKGSFAYAMQVAAGKIPLDVNVNQDKIVNDIRNAINKASKAEFEPVQVKLQVNKQSIKDRITEELQSISPGHLTAVSEAYQNMLNSILQAHDVLGKSSGINNVVNALARLGNVDLRKFDTGKLNEIITAIMSLSSMSESAVSVGKLISALARLANVGDVVSTTAQALPALGGAIKGAFEDIASVNISEVIERVLNAFTRLALSGEKANVAAQNLPNVTAAVRGFFDAMAEVPAISDTTLRMVESFTALATTGRRIGAVGNQVTKAFKDVDNAGTKTVKTFRDVSGNSNLVINAFKKMLGACKNAVSGLGSGAKKLLSHFKQIGQGSNHLQKATLSLKNLLQVAVGFYGIRSLFNWGKDAVEFASDLTEVQNVVENSFGTKGTKNVEQFAETANKSFGMTELTAKKVAARYQAMGNAMGITAGQVAQATQNVAKNLNADLYDDTGEAMGAMSINLTKLAADMASFYNVEQDTAAEALNAVYTGQTRPLRQYGLDLTQATLEEWAHKQGIEGKISAMTQAEKTMLRYQYVMAQTSTIQGDFARTSDTWANQVRMLKQNLQALGGVVGGTLINAFKPLVSWLNTAISAVTSFAETVGNALGKIFGWKILHTPASNAADAYGTLSEGLDDAGSSGEDAAGGIGDATKAAEEYKNTVLGFDELNKLNDVKDPTSTSGKSGGSGQGDGGSAIPSADGTGADFQIVKQQSWLEDYKSSIDSLRELGSYISGVLTNAMEDIDWDSIYETARDFGTGLADFLNGLITPELFSALGGTIAGAINTVLNGADAFLDQFDFTNLGNSIGSGINRFFKDWDAGLTSKVFYKTVNGIADAIKAACDEISWNSIGTKVSTMVRNALGGIQWKEKVYPAADSFGTGIANYLNGLIKPSTFWKIGESVSGVLNTALHILDTFGSTFDFKNFGKSIASAIEGFFKTWDADLTADTFNKLANGILTSISTALGDVNWKRIGAKISGMIANIEWGTLLENVGTVIMNAINAALDLASGLFDGTPVEGVIEDLKTKLNGIANTIDFPKISKGIGDIVDALSPAVEGFGKGLIDALGKFAEIGAVALNFIGIGLQTIADALNSLPPGTLEAIGNSLGKVAGALLAIKLADKGVTTILSLIGGLTGGGTAAAVGETATAIGVAGTNATTSVAPVSTFFKTVVTKADPVALVAGSLMTFAQSIDEARFHAEGGKGPVTDFYAAVEGMRGVLSDDLLDKLQSMAIEFANNGVEGEDAAKKLAKFFTDEKIDPATIELALANVSEALGDANPFIDVIRQSFTLMGEDAVTAAKKASMTDKDYQNLRTSIADVAAEYGLSQDEQEMFYGLLEKSKQSSSTTEAAYKAVREELVRMYGEGSEKVATFDAAVQEHAPNAFNAIKTGAETADEKSGTFWSNLFGNIGEVATNALKMLVMGAGFDTLGDKSGDAKDDVSDLDTAVNNFVTKIPTYASDTKKNSADLIGNCFAGGEQAITDKSGAFQKSFENALIWNPQKAMKEGNGIHSPSTVYYGFGENIVAGMKNAINDKGSTVVSALKNVMNNMKNAITGQYDEFESKGESLAGKFKSGLKSVSFSSVASSWKRTLDMSDLEDTLYDAGYDAARALADGLDSVSMPTLSYYVSDWDYHDLGDGNYSSTPIYSPQWYAKGGFPNMGELFVANENGIEMMGRMGHRNVVANNQQITEGIKAAVVDGMMEVFMSTNSGNDELPYQFNIKMVTPDGEVLAQQVERGKAKRDARFNTVGYSYG